MEDSRIVDLYWERSEHAITETASKYGKYCYAIAHNILRNSEDADESVNDTYLGAWNSTPPHRPSILRTYLGKITRRISLKKWRDKNRDKRGGGEVAFALALVAVIAALLTLCGFAAYELGWFDTWLQKPSVNPTDTVRSAIENQIGKEYTITVRVDEI